MDVGQAGGMSMAISKQELDSLIEHRGHPDGRVLSIYLDVDQSKAANLRRGYLPALRDRLRAIESQLPDELKVEFGADSTRTLDFILAYDPRGRGLVLFCDASQDFLWHRELQVPMRNEVRWESSVFVRPLVEMVDEYERYAVVLVSRDEARLVTVYMGEIEETREIQSPDKRKRFKQTAKDNRMSQSNLQRKDDEHAHLHLKEVAEVVEELAARRRLGRLLLSGPHEITRELRSLLPRRVQDMVLNSLSLPVDASEQQVLKETLRLEEEIERAQESEAVEKLITAASKDSQAVLELRRTLEALRLGRIMKLVYVQDLAAPGSQCTNCASMFAGEAESCVYCGAAVRALPDVVSRLVETVVDAGGEAESVRGPAAQRLRGAGGIGAFLRF